MAGCFFVLLLLIMVIWSVQIGSTYSVLVTISASSQIFERDSILWNYFNHVGWTELLFLSMKTKVVTTHLSKNFKVLQLN